jgi:hypothetical protein
MNDTQSPITGICLVSKPNNVPTGYHCIRKGKDNTVFLGCLIKVKI